MLVEGASHLQLGNLMFSHEFINFILEGNDIIPHGINLALALEVASMTYFVCNQYNREVFGEIRTVVATETIVPILKCDERSMVTGIKHQTTRI